MTVKEVEARVAEIRMGRRDSEVAGSNECALWSDVLRAIASGRGDDPAQLAHAAIATSNIQFSRWYA